MAIVLDKKQKIKESLKKKNEKNKLQKSISLKSHVPI